MCGLRCVRVAGLVLLAAGCAGEAPRETAAERPAASAEAPYRRAALDQQMRLEAERGRARKQFADAWASVTPGMPAGAVDRLLGEPVAGDRWEVIPPPHRESARVLSKSPVVPDARRTWMVEDGSGGVWT